MTALSPTEPPHPFTAPERALIRRALDAYFGRPPSLADGLPLRTWRSGRRAGQPKPTSAVRGMVERGLLEVRAHPDGPGARAYFTAAGLAALRELARDRDQRSLPPARYAHIRRELGLEAGLGEMPTPRPRRIELGAVSGRLAP